MPKITLEGILLEIAAKKKRGSKQDLLLPPKNKNGKPNGEYDENQELIVDKDRFTRIKKSYEAAPKLHQKQGIRTREEVEEISGPIDGSEFLTGAPRAKGTKKNNNPLIGYGPWEEVKVKKKA